MTQRRLFVLVILGAIVMGFISGKLLLFNGSALNIFPWGVLAFGVSFLAMSKRQAIKFSAAFSFIVSFSFLLFNNTGTTNLMQALKLIVAACIASSFGLLCGIFIGWLAWNIRRQLKKESRSR
jgi:hypothetical protein